MERMVIKTKNGVKREEKPGRGRKEWVRGKRGYVRKCLTTEMSLNKGVIERKLVIRSAIAGRGDGEEQTL